MSESAEFDPLTTAERVVRLQAEVARLTGIIREMRAAAAPGRDYDEPDEAIGIFDPPYELRCPRCAGPMSARVGHSGALVLLECEGECRRAWQAPVKGSP